MTKERRSEIERYAGQIRELLGIRTPVNRAQLESAVESLGGTVESGVPTGSTDASIHKTEDNGFTIVISPDKSTNRQIFSLAHELGHLFLHMNRANPERWREARSMTHFPRQGYSEREYEAHAFAAPFLMPENEFRGLAGESPESLAAHFGVSVDAVLNRGRWLEIYEWTKTR